MLTLIQYNTLLPRPQMNMSQVPYTPEDIEAAHLLLQIYHSSMNNPNQTHSQKQSGQQIFAESHGEIRTSAASNPVSMANFSTVVNARPLSRSRKLALPVVQKKHNLLLQQTQTEPLRNQPLSR